MDCFFGELARFRGVAGWQVGGGIAVLLIEGPAGWMIE
jgi:hypothetical protein